MEHKFPEFRQLLEGLQADKGYILVLTCFIIFNFFLWSACWACSTAEKREHSPLVGFMLGLIIPGLYPLYSYFMLKPVSVAEAEKSEKKAKEENRDVLADEDIFGDSDLDIGPSYFRKIYRDQSGAPEGPFTIELEGNMIVAETIAEVHDNFIVITLRTDEDKTQRLRIPYSDIQNCTKEPGQQGA